MADAAFDLRRAGRVAEDEEMRSRAVHEPERDAGVERVHDRALALDEEQLSPAPCALDDELLGGAREEVGDDRVDGDAPAGDRDAGLTRRHEDRREAPRARLEVELDGDGLLADRAVRADGEDDLRVDLEVRPGRDVEPRRRLAQVAQRDAVLARERRSARDPRRRTRAGRSRRRGPAAMQSFRRSRHAGGKRPPCVATPTTATVGSYASASSTVADDRDALVALARPLRVEDRDDRIRPVADDPAHRLAVVRVVREALAEDEEAARPASCPRRDAEARRRATASARRRRTRRPATGPRAAAGCRRGRRGRRAARRSSPPRSRAPTRACSRASRPCAAPARRARCGSPRGCRPTSRA